ncbi:MAG: hypothetical protein H6712_17170 [Myxococcales bacterium]|nr:hypothetical protein [Myxococcales bacterium]MCB9715603.1 hypothetical protein [Myxococcales bacterium]
MACAKVARLLEPVMAELGLDDIRALELRGLPLSRAQRRRIESCPDAELLRRWLDRALLATDVAEVFAGDGPSP